MTVAVVVCVLLFVGACIFGLCVRNVRMKSMVRIRELRLKRLEFEMEVKDLDREVLLTGSRVETLRRELEELELARRMEREAAARGDVPDRSVVDVLQHNGRITAEDVLRARTFLENTKNGCTEEEALIILGLVTDADIQAAAGELE